MTASPSWAFRRPGYPAGFTLLELLLTLSMSVVLMVLIGGVMEFYGRDMVNSDIEVRQVQLASAVMQMIEDDLRATLHTEPVDTSGLEKLFASLGSGDSGGGAADGSGTAEDDSLAEEDMAAGDASAATLSLTTGAAVLQKPGLIGNQFQIQLDVSRLPRLEEYVAILDESVADLDDVPSDIKTVAYFVQGEGTIGGVDDPLSEDGSGVSGGSGGLVRRSLDRAATVHAAVTGGTTQLNQTGEVLAPEIVGIEFAYWDGLMWQIEWSSDEFGELPLAVRVTLTMLDPVATAATGSGGGEPSTRSFVHIVRLPMARPIDTDDTLVTGVGG